MAAGKSTPWQSSVATVKQMSPILLCCPTEKNEGECFLLKHRVCVGR